jgi:fibro-slime domain-containing protein
MSLRDRLALFSVLGMLATGLSCSANAPSDTSLTGGSNGTGVPAGGSSSGTNPSGGSANNGTGASGVVCVDPTPETPGCGNGKHDMDEECDDSNTNPGDGCSPACRVEADFKCPGDPAMPDTLVGACTPDMCGNGHLASFEACDDGNTNPGDGCSPACRVEADFKCPGDPAMPDTLVGACTPDMCGNGHLASFEACDDGNTNPGDGCSADCKTIEDGWECRVPGKKCVPLCGDGKLAGTEACDDMNAIAGDGCSPTCLVEPGATCDNTTLPSKCTKAMCGNMMKEAGEGCDLGPDNGLFNGDGTGCSKTCTQEPKCRGDDGVTRACDTHCGDANKDEGEECDDGNGQDHDGCSHDCKVEPGFTCMDKEQPDTVPCPSNPALQCLVLPMVYRDFDPTTNPDFFYLGKNSVTCVPDASGTASANTGTCPATDQSGPCLGLASATLDKDGTPAAGTTTMCRCIFTDHDDTGVIASSPTCSRSDGSTRHHIDTMIKGITDIKKWYSGPGVHGTLELAQSGQQYQFSSSVMGAPAGAVGTTIQQDIHANCLGTARPLQSGFFPLDTATGAAATKYCNLWPYWALGTSEASCVTGPSLTIKAQWDPQTTWDGCPMTGTDGGFVPKSDGSGTPLQGQKHNFYYTSVARYLFRYNGTPSQLAFFGDDDVFVYVNGKLKVDLGAPHQQLMGVAGIGDAADNLVAGKIYEIAVFHADRHPRDANYQLTLSSFSTVKSECQPTCGDGVATAAEECDCGNGTVPTPDGCPGPNMDGVYGGCDSHCKYGGWCGDGITNGPEECDMGKANGVSYSKDKGGGCSFGCTWAHFCGDGKIDGKDGEECDDGDKNGTGRCKAGCMLGGPK